VSHGRQALAVKPGTKDGTPADVFVRMEMTFTLNQHARKQQMLRQSAPILAAMVDKHERLIMGGVNSLDTGRLD
jgi:hypothetical protein